MKKLYILRHAKPVDPGVMDDFSRTLTRRGIHQATALGLAIKERAIQVDHILCSPAVRTQETAQALMEAAGLACPIETRQTLYNAAGQWVLDEIRQAPDEADNLLVVAHMPGVAELWSLLAKRGSGPGVDFRPCALAALDTGVDQWAKLEPYQSQPLLEIPPLS